MNKNRIFKKITASIDNWHQIYMIYQLIFGKKPSDKPHCIRCGTKNFDVRNPIYIDHVLCEYEIYCKDCGLYVDYWTYGYWESANK